MGIALVVMGLIMKDQHIETMTKGNQDTTTVIGAAAGVGVGVGAGLAIGGIGVAACGTGIGIPVGVVCLGLASVFGTVGGAIGHESGTPDSVEQVLVYSPALCYIIMAIGACLILFAVFLKINPAAPAGLEPSEISTAPEALEDSAIPEKLEAKE